MTARFWLFATLAVALAACASQPDSAVFVPTAAAESVGVVATRSADTVGLVARVNGVGISQLTFDMEMARRTSSSQIADQNALGQQVLDGLIEREIVRQYARQMGIEATVEEARAEIEALKAALENPADWERFLAVNDMTEPELVTTVLEQLVTAKVREQLFAPLYGEVVHAHARHILVGSPEEAAALLGQLQQGASFEDLARQHSIDNATRDTGGDLGWFVANELIDQRLGQVIFSLQPGAIAGPIQTRVGYHIVQLIETDTRPIEENRLGVLMDAVYSQWLQAQLTSATIERFR